MDSLLLKTFLEVSQKRNFGKASESLCVSPSTVSARIKQLEEHIGLALFTRKHHQVSLTPAGERMERHARFILSAWERAYEDTALSERHKKRLVIAGVSSLWDIFLQDWLNDVYQNNPTLSLRAEESTPLRVIDKLERRMIDLGFLYEPVKLPDVAVEAISSIPLLLVSSQTDQTIEQAISEGYIRVEWGTTFASLHESYFPQRLLARGRVNSGKIALNLLLQCGGAAYLPQNAITPLLKKGQLHLVKDAPVIEMKAYAAYLLHSEHRDLISTLLRGFNS